ncbi:hypothetical protein [Pseudophaeobacter sp.]|uniref:hypothetical protein n=1 Tax=Pseudophaeobacter sp. TaxID=1971739 RepID=UPI003298386D
MISFPLVFPVSYVLHIGAGSGSEVAGYQAAGLDPIVLVEADDEAVAALQQHLGQSSAVQVVQAAVTGRSGSQQFHRCNFADLSSLSEPAPALWDLFAGLEVMSREPMAGVSPQDLLAGCTLPQQGGQGLLVIEAPGEALAILRALAAVDRLAQFPLLRLQEGEVSLYRDAPGQAALQAALAELGYDSWIEADPEDPDRPYLLACQNRAAQQKDTELATLRSETQRQLALRDADLEELQLRYAALRDRRNQLEDLLRRLEAKIGPLLATGAEPETASLAAKGRGGGNRRERKKTDPA